MKFNEADAIIDSLNNLKKLDDTNIEAALGAYANLAPIMKKLDKFVEFQEKIRKYFDNHSEEYQVSVSGCPVVATGHQPCPKTEWNDTLLKNDAGLEVISHCKPEYENFFKKATAAIDSNACKSQAIKDSSFLARYGIDKTTTKGTITLL